MGSVRTNATDPATTARQFADALAQRVEDAGGLTAVDGQHQDPIITVTVDYLATKPGPGPMAAGRRSFSQRVTNSVLADCVQLIHPPTAA